MINATSSRRLTMWRFWIFPPSVRKVVFQNLKMLMRSRKFAQRAKLHHFHGSIHQPGREALKTGTVITVGRQNSPLPSNSVVSGLNDVLEVSLLGEDHELHHPRDLLVWSGHQVPALRGVVVDLEARLQECSANVVLIILCKFFVENTKVSRIFPG